MNLIRVKNKTARTFFQFPAVYSIRFPTILLRNNLNRANVKDKGTKHQSDICEALVIHNLISGECSQQPASTTLPINWACRTTTSRGCFVPVFSPVLALSFSADDNISKSSMLFQNSPSNFKCIGLLVLGFYEKLKTKEPFSFRWG